MMTQRGGMGKGRKTQGEGDMFIIMADLLC